MQQANQPTQYNQPTELDKIWRLARESQAAALRTGRHKKTLPVFVPPRKADAVIPNHALPNVVFAEALAGAGSPQETAPQTSASTLMDHIYGDGSRRTKQREGTKTAMSWFCTSAETRP
jgi:hypothetical protein